MQWVVNAYLIALAALFALGGRLSDIFGHTKLCVIGVLVFVGASVMCGLTPTGSFAEAWIVGFRAVQGAGGALMFPAALAIVVNTFPLRDRGKALALFFGIAGGLTAMGPILGGYLTQWTWRAIFWVNVPVALIALVLIAVSKPKTQYRRAPIDYPGAVLIAAGIALSIFGLQQSVPVGLEQPVDLGLHRRRSGLIVIFVLVELPHRFAADRGLHLPHPTFRHGEPDPDDLHDGVHPDLLLRQRVRPDLLAQVGFGGGCLPPVVLRRLRGGRADRRADARP